MFIHKDADVDAAIEAAKTLDQIFIQQGWDWEFNDERRKPTEFEISQMILSHIEMLDSVDSVYVESGRIAILEYDGQYAIMVVVDRINKDDT